MSIFNLLINNIILFTEIFIEYLKEFGIDIIKAIWFLLPAYVANSMPVVLYKIEFLNYPVDFNKKINGKRIFGSHKTWRGLFFGILIGTLTAYLQKQLYNIEFFKIISVYNYEDALLFGFLMSSGALIGDLIESYFKRQLNIPSGNDWYVADQYDFLLGALLFTINYWPKDILFIIAMFFISPILHIISNYLKPLFMNKSKKNS